MRSVSATPLERRRRLPGDDLVAADVVMDRAFTVEASPAEVWPWLVQLGKGRAGWYLPRRVERLLPPGRRAVRDVVTQWQALHVGEVVPDYGGREACFEVSEVEAPHHLVYTSRRGRTDLSWALVLEEVDAAGCRVQARLRLGPVRRPWLAGSLGEVVDVLTVAGMASGLRERVER